MTLEIEVYHTRMHGNDRYIGYKFSGYDGIGTEQALKVELYGKDNCLLTNHHDGILKQDGEFKISIDNIRKYRKLAIVASIGNERAIDTVSVRNIGNEKKDRGR